MTTNWQDLIQRYISGTLTDAEAQSLEQQLRADRMLRDWYLDAVNLDSALTMAAESAQMALSLPVPLSQRVLAPVRQPKASWLAWRPLTAAAAGIFFGMLCTSVVFGLVNQRTPVMKKVSLNLFDPSFEDVRQIIHDGLVRRVGQWGMDEAKVVTAEGVVKPLRGKGMMRLEPVPKDEDMKNRPSRIYQMLDLRSLQDHPLQVDTEVEISASFCAATSHLKSRYVMRVFALDEAPEQATKNFWSKVEGDGIPSETQRFDVAPGDSGWHTFSLKLRLPPDTKTLMIVLGFAPPNEANQSSSVHYVDELQVSLISPELPLP